MGPDEQESKYHYYTVKEIERLNAIIELHRTSITEADKQRALMKQEINRVSSGVSFCKGVLNKIAAVIILAVTAAILKMVIK